MNFERLYVEVKAENVKLKYDETENEDLFLTEDDSDETLVEYDNLPKKPGVWGVFRGRHAIGIAEVYTRTDGVEVRLYKTKRRLVCARFIVVIEDDVLTFNYEIYHPKLNGIGLAYTLAEIAKPFLPVERPKKMQYTIKNRGFSTYEFDYFSNAYYKHFGVSYPDSRLYSRIVCMGGEEDAFIQPSRDIVEFAKVNADQQEFIVPIMKILEGCVSYKIATTFLNQRITTKYEIRSSSFTVTGEV